MFTTDLQNRIFFIKADQYGTAFTIEIDNREYLISAKHLFDNAKNTETIKLKYAHNWHERNVTYVGEGHGEIDIAVFAMTNTYLTPTKFKLDATSAGLIWGQEVFFVGFPYKMDINLDKNLTGGRPTPFMKKGIISAMDFSQDASLMYIDAINNEGFSGGPLVFVKQGKPNNEYSVAGVISKFKTEREPVKRTSCELKTNLYVDYNTGLLVAYNIRYAIEIIKNKPIGLIVKSQ